MPARPSHARKSGFSFVEVVAATALLGLIAASTAGLMGFVTGGQVRQQQRLAAAELANRLLIQFLDDPTQLPGKSRLIDYGAFKYRWEYAETPIRVVPARPSLRERGRAAPAEDRLFQVSVRVWLSEASGGSSDPNTPVPQMTLTRMVNPLAIRNLDSAAEMLRDPARFEEFIRRMVGGAGGVGGVGGAAPAPAPAPGRPGGGRGR